MAESQPFTDSQGVGKIFITFTGKAFCTMNLTIFLENGPGMNLIKFRIKLMEKEK